MKSIEIVVHCWSGDMPCYAKMLTAQLSALLKWPPRAKVKLTVWAGIGDDRTFAALSAFYSPLRDVGIHLEAMIVEKSRLFRRAIGRNASFRASDADIVWAADGDALMADGCIDALAASEFTGLAFPREVRFHPTHAHGDADIATIVPGVPFIPDLQTFRHERIKFASGGYLIVDGETARRGFMDGTKWVAPADPAGGFIDPREDIAYRKQFTSSTPLALPNLFRFRHSESPFQKASDRLAQTAGRA